ncbi:ABC transporter ATP-binding protein [Tuwongella immobilis]|uniref:ABC transporter ATP-binding protein n=1 Tax=Tuwongella immobilis TaxID=692036 RepID=A0A6C2YM21_9BACT|nr:ABC transporter ATP-binding protein [Tuwongella immobilis]VIP02361.1 lipid a export atp-binding permease protein : ABC-type multidrug transport system, ATPase and permease component OS=Singulisphaera acidiphila (strain ATCC BAA-1392 / DSM 18658 / VKM B-2454 / MOB10) GN=Sinac_2921 PE=3 SV=1: ABC_membrane: ABC_tran [Tuwongella immobilis]VTS01169.1 lipid a export atp-binding permease protein : ABC-type multidrug transport system, ATPase and permease component OS=Singulisphaera acidiphila (strain 
MKNFLRCLKYSWVYRTRLILSIVCAFIAAGFWGLNFTAIYPALQVMGKGQNLQQWVDKTIDETEVNIAKLKEQLDSPGGPRAQMALVQTLEPSSFRERREHELSGAIAKLESKITAESTWLFRCQQLRTYFIRFLPQDRFQTLAVLLGMVLASIILKGIFEFGQEWLVGSITNRTLYDMRNRFYRKVLHHDMRQYNQAGSSELMARFTNDMENVGNGLKVLYGRVVAEPLRAFACVFIACLISWQLTLLFMVLVPLALVTLTKVSRMMKRATRRLLEGMSQIYKILQETFTGIRVVKAFTMESYERRRFNRVTKEYYNQAMKVITIDSLAGPIVEILGIAAVMTALLAGAYLVLEGKTHLFGMRMTQHQMEVETLLQLYVLLAAIADPVRKLSSVYTKLQSAAAASDRVFAYMDREPQVKANATGPMLERVKDRIEFRDICFSYEAGRDILTNIQLTVKSGETVALVGKNGCGKTTLLGLLPRFYDPDHGAILIDGVPVRDLNLRSLRRQIAIVSQETVLFDDTIYNNIAYGNRKAGREEVEAAARAAHVHDFILEKLPHGYDTVAGEAAHSLSGGTRQKIALARAIVRDPSILILDEFTSQYDAESEADVNEAIKEFMKGRTTFIITHRLHTLQMVDRIVVLDGGRVQGIGTHEQLIHTCPMYQRLFEAAILRKSA